MPTALHTRFEFDAELQGFKAHQKNSRSSKVMALSYSEQISVALKTEGFYTTGYRKKVDCINVDEFADIALQCLSQWIAFISAEFVKIQLRPAFCEEDFVLER